jgi:putative flippase GtrA
MKIKSQLDVLVQQKRIGQFVSVGAVGATIETIIVVILTTSVGLGPLTAKAVGAETSISTMFIANDRWTFAGEGRKGTVAVFYRWVKSHMVRAVGLLIAFSVLYLLTTVIEFKLLLKSVDFWPTVANIIGILVGMIINYVAESIFTWGVQ